MQRIEIENFGPIKNVAFDIKDYTVFIGPQASGKSTITRAINYFTSLRNNLHKNMLDTSDFSLDEWGNMSVNEFCSYWDSSYFQKNGSLKFFFDDTKFVSVRVNPDGITLDASDTFKTEITDGIVAVQTLLKDIDFPIKLLESQFGSLASLWVSKIKLQARNTEYAFVNNYIPAGRSVFLNLRNELAPNMAPFNDILVSRFIGEANVIRHELSKIPVEMRLKQMSDTTPPSTFVRQAEKMRQYALLILNGEYRQIDKKDYILVDSTAIPIGLSSSGQQESLWILLYAQFYLMILAKYEQVNHRCFQLFTLIEEPEAHLFPESQKHMMSVLTLLANTNKNRLMLTTHSPYILTPLNNLLLAHHIGQNKREAVEKIIDPDLWIDPDRFECYYVDHGTINSVMDRNTGMIDLAGLDAVSGTLNDQYDQLTELED